MSKFKKAYTVTIHRETVLGDVVNVINLSLLGYGMTQKIELNVLTVG